MLGDANLCNVPNLCACEIDCIGAYWGRRQHGVIAQPGANHMAVLSNIQQQLDAALAVIASQKALLDAASKPKALTMKVSEKGALSIYGLGRFPITLYRGQMERLLAHSDVIKAFIETNAALLSVKV